MSVLPYLTPRTNRPVGAIILLWLWVVVDGFFGFLFIFFGFLEIFIPAFDTGDVHAWGLLLQILGLLLGIWGVHVGRLAARFQREGGAAQQSYSACQWAGVVLLGVLALTIASAVVTSIRDDEWLPGWIGLLVPETVVLVGIGVTLTVLRRARDEEMAWESKARLAREPMDIGG